jgi:regulation of enolase protein 1 (concanavalin A-like superfamily)
MMNKSEIKKYSFNPDGFSWINKPGKFIIDAESLTLYTDPCTDFWQRTYYGFRNDNAHAFLTGTTGDFTFSVKTSFAPNTLYDQCGIVLYRDSDNWIKASVEYENSDFARLGSVVTNLGYSDWASTDISSSIKTIWYRLSRRGQDFLIEHSSDGIAYFQMRMLHMHLNIDSARIGIYACSPGKSSFKTHFSELTIGPCTWAGYTDN